MNAIEIYRDCMFCSQPYRPFNGLERVCSPRCAGDLARREHPDLRMSEYKKQAPLSTPKPPKPSVANALAETRASVAGLKAPMADFVGGRFEPTPRIPPAVDFDSLSEYRAEPLPRDEDPGQLGDILEWARRDPNDQSES